MVKPLVFKGDKPKKRKHGPEPTANGPRLSTVSTDPAPAAVDEDSESWVSAEAVSDVAGPILVVLPMSPPAALACDANGSVFSMDIENMVDDNPSSAEPHDVRQVWVVSRVAGTEHVQLKGHHGK